ncbi:hypothetical protein FACS18948_7210 [Clostridia bacterium]|nr:hypothetical protein FACS18948_7210 [Clostridia bacterium]
MNKDMIDQIDRAGVVLNAGDIAAIEKILAELSAINVITMQKLVKIKELILEK